MYEVARELGASSLPVGFTGVSVFICPHQIINVAFLCTQMLVKVVMKAAWAAHEWESGGVKMRAEGET